MNHAVVLIQCSWIVLSLSFRQLFLSQHFKRTVNRGEIAAMPALSGRGIPHRSKRRILAQGFKDCQRCFVIFKPFFAS
jgi:hypothetical protein